MEGTIWEVHYDDEDGTAYYYNTKTNAVSWEGRGRAALSRFHNHFF